MFAIAGNACPWIVVVWLFESKPGRRFSKIVASGRDVRRISVRSSSRIMKSPSCRRWSVSWPSVVARQARARLLASPPQEGQGGRLGDRCRPARQGNHAHCFRRQRGTTCRVVPAVRHRRISPERQQPPSHWRASATRHRIAAKHPPRLGPQHHGRGPPTVKTPVLGKAWAPHLQRAGQ